MLRERFSGEKIYKIFTGFSKEWKKTLEATLFARRLFFLDDGEMGSLNCHDVSNNRDTLEESTFSMIPFLFKLFFPNIKHFFTNRRISPL